MSETALVSIPREFKASGYTPGCSVLVEELPGGELRIARSTLEGALATRARDQNAEFALQSSVLAHGVAEGQPFLDGNQRLALVAMLTFFEATAAASTPPTQNAPTGSSS